jgi:hypothetical protein
MRSRLTRSEWTIALVLIAAAAGVVAWSTGLPRRLGHDGPGQPAPSAARRTLDLLVELTPRPGSRGFPSWRELARLGPPDPALSGSIGFDGERLFIRREDDGVRWTVALLLDISTGVVRPAATLLECQPADPRSPWEVRELRAAWPFSTEDAGAGWRTRWRDPRLAAEIEARVRLVLGGHRPADVPSELSADYQLLLDPLLPIEYAPAEDVSCGLAAGRAAVERLLTAGRTELVANALRGLDPEGRVYAAEALLALGSPEPEDERAARAVLALEVPIRVRGGPRRPARELVRPALSGAESTSR